MVVVVVGGVRGMVTRGEAGFVAAASERLSVRAAVWGSLPCGVSPLLSTNSTGSLPGSRAKLL